MSSFDGQLTVLVSQLSTEEKVRLLAGRGYWHTEAVDRLGIPSMHLSDGPVGVRGARTVGETSVSFPCGSAIGATFDPAAAGELADALADECIEKGVHVLLGPTINIQRHPLGGRHFECYAEDPFLTADLAVAYVRGLQARGIAATVKHFIANDTEYHRHTISSDVDADVLRRLYLVPFEDAVDLASPWALMTSYNKINGTYAAEHAELVEDLLRREWGYDGLVMSDWFGAQSTAPSANAGLDLEMPGPPAHYGERLLEAVQRGEVSTEVLDERARRVLQLAERTDAAATSSRRRPVHSVQERRQLSADLAKRSFVLLANDRDVLPLSLGQGSVLAVIGPNAAVTSGQGGGSAQVHPSHTVSVLEGLRQRFEPLGVEVVHEPGCVTWEDTPPAELPVHLEYQLPEGSGVRFEEDTPHWPLLWLGDPVPGVKELVAGSYMVRASSQFTPERDGSHRFVLSQVGSARLLVDGAVVAEGSSEPSRRFFGLGSADVTGEVVLAAGRTVTIVVEYTVTSGSRLGGIFLGILAPLPADDELIASASDLARRADAVVCVVGTTAEWESEGHDRATMELPGRQDDLVRAVAQANPSVVVLVNAGSPVSMDWAPDVGALGQIWFPGECGGSAVAEVLSGDAEPGGRLPHTIPVRIEDTPAFSFYPHDEHDEERVSYGEGLLVGYRHYATTGTAPRYWFGHGITYTSFELSGAAVSGGSGSAGGETSSGGETSGAESAGGHTVTATVRNIGKRSGSQVVQVYLERADDSAASGEPAIQYLGSARATLDPGESTTVSIPVSKRRLGRLAVGRYHVRVGTSADSAKLQPAGEIVLSEGCEPR